LSETVPLEGLLGSRAGFLLTYPGCDDEEGGARLLELRGLGVEALVLTGRHVLHGVPVLGKGHVGVVVAALMDGRRVALKIRRVDADRASLEAEASNLRVANGVSVGPEFVGVSTNFLAMELVEGEYLVDWVRGLGPSDGNRLRRVFRAVLGKARRLDEVGLDHGELSRADRHIVVAGEEPRIVDFESASVSRRCGNVTSLVQYLFFNQRVRGLVAGIIRPPDGRGLLLALQRYKREPTDEMFLGVLLACGLAE
jgi:putative serine/threonine protein kinase